jgi:hypothetical protein
VKHFLYTYSERTPRNGHTEKTVRIWRVLRNKPVHVATATDTFVDENQLVMETMEKHKLLPKAVFVRHKSINSYVNTLWQLNENRVVSVTKVY